MAQRSFPQAGTGVGDSGPYSGDEVAEFYQAVFTGDQQAIQGPIRLFLNELEVTEAALAVTTATGAGFVYGRFLINDAAVVINIALAAAGQERYDRVVMVENNTNAVYNTNLALPADYAAGVPRNSARIAILQGTEAGAAVLPPLLTGPNYYMVELARYLVDDATVGTVDDRRAFCEFSHKVPNRTRQFFVQPVGGYNSYTSTFIPIDALTFWRLGVILDDGTWSGAWGHTIVPADYASGLTSTGVLLHIAGGVANIAALNGIDSGHCGENFRTHMSATPVAGIVATAGNDNYSCLLEVNAPSEIEAGEILSLRFLRYGDDGDDTLGEDIVFFGWIISYTADS